MKKIFLIFFTFHFSIISFGGNLDTLSVYSKSMKKEIKTTVLTPESYNDKLHFPVLYLLHGYSGNYATMSNTKNFPNVIELADKYQMIIVMPDGGYNSWYLNSPVDSTSKYETFVSKELISYVDKKFKTIPAKEGRAITGLSMGGHGALYLTFRHQDIFGACGSMSGGVDLRPFPNNWNIKEKLGEQKEFPERWKDYSVIGLLHLLKPDGVKIIIDCGTDDFFYNVNENLHKQLIYRNIPHDYISRPGKHNAKYWSNSLDFQTLFFNKYFYEKE